MSKGGTSITREFSLSIERNDIPIHVTTRVNHGNMINVKETDYKRPHIV